MKQLYTKQEVHPVHESPINSAIWLIYTPTRSQAVALELRMRTIGTRDVGD